MTDNVPRIPRMTFNMPLKYRKMFTSDKTPPRIYKVNGEIVSREGDSGNFDITIKDEQGNASKGILKNNGHDCWTGSVGNYLAIELKYQHSLKRGYVRIDSKKIRKNPYTKKKIHISALNAAPLHISDAHNSYISTKDPKRIFFNQKKNDNHGGITGSLIKTQNNALRKVQFQCDGEKFEGEMSLPMMDMQHLIAPTPVAMGYAIGNKGSLAKVVYSEIDKKRRTFYAKVQPKEFTYWDNELRKDQEKITRLRHYVVKNI